MYSVTPQHCPFHTDHNRSQSLSVKTGSASGSSSVFLLVINEEVQVLIKEVQSVIRMFNTLWKNVKQHVQLDYPPLSSKHQIRIFSCCCDPRVYSYRLYPVLSTFMLRFTFICHQLVYTLSDLMDFWPIVVWIFRLA